MDLLRKISLLTLLLALFQAGLADTLYVDQNVVATEKDGQSWETAFLTLGEAVNSSSEGDEIWITKGEYTPENISTYNTLSIYGGFSGKENSTNERDPATARTNLQSGGVRFDISKSNIIMNFEGINCDGFELYVSHENGVDYLNNVTINIRNCRLNTGSNYFLFDDPNQVNIYLEECELDDLVYFGSSIIEVVDCFVNTLPHVGFAETFKLANSTFFVQNSQQFNADDITIQGCLFGAGSKFYIHLVGEKVKILNNEFQSITSNSFLFPLAGSVSDLNFEGNLIEKSEVNGLFAYTYRNQLLNKVTFNNNTFSDNTFSIRAVAHIYGRQVEMNNNIFSNNHFGSSTEGLRFENGEHIKIDGLQFLDNTGAGSGYSPDAFNVRGFDTVEVSNLDIRSNIIGNGLIALMNIDLLNMENLSFIDNEINGDFTYEMSLMTIGRTNGSIKYSLIQNNTIHHEAGIYIYDDTLDFEGVHFINNSFKQGEIYNAGDGNISLSQSKFIGNKGYDQSNTNQIGSINLVPHNNFFRYSTSLHINDCEFINNDYYGNIQALMNSKYVEVFNSRFIGNKGGAAGGMFNTPNLIIANSLFDNNTSNLGSGSITNSSDFEIYNSTFFRNSMESSNAAQLFRIVSNTSGKIYNSIIWNNGPGSFGNPDQTYNEQFLDIQHSNIQGGFPGTGNLDTLPHFIDPENGDFRLSCNSPLLNKGSNQYAPDMPDMYGVPRIRGDTADMGAFEFDGDPSVADATAYPSFDASDFNPCKSEEVTFTNSTANKDYFNYRWDFGDNSPLFSGADTSHSYSETGTYHVKLTAANACGQSFTDSAEITVKPSYIPQILYPTTVCAGDTVTFSTNAECSSLEWSVQGGEISEGEGTSEITVIWGDGAEGNGVVALNATQCGNSDVCEFPVQEEIPVIPEKVNILGDTAVCLSSGSSFITDIRDFIPGAVYTWSVDGGAIDGNASGYNLDSVYVNWSSSATQGMVYLSIEHEVLNCIIKDSFAVKVNPAYEINPSARDFCVTDEQQFESNQSGDFFWSVNTSEHSIDPSSGLAAFSAVPGDYIITALPADSSAFCNYSDTLQISVHDRPVMESVTGETEVDGVTPYNYTATYSGNESLIRWNALNSSYNMSTGAEQSIIWNQGEPFGFKVHAESVAGACSSDTITYNVIRDFVYDVSGPDTLCVMEEGTFSVNEDTENPSEYSWKLNGREISGSTSVVTAQFDKPGFNTITAEVTRKSKLYTASGQVYVESLPGTITVDGNEVIAPEGGGTYQYEVHNQNDLDIEYVAEGAAEHSMTDNVITVTWDSEGPYGLKVYGTAEGEDCSSEPAVLNIRKAPALAEEITVTSGAACSDNEAVYTVQTDNYASGIRWSLDGGGTIIESNNNTATILWGNTEGEYELKVSYERFGSRSVSKTVEVNPLPEPQIEDVTVCGEEPATMTTTTTFSSYAWFSEPEGTQISGRPSAVISEGGIYKVRVTDNNGCAGVTSRFIKNIPFPVAAISSSVSNICVREGSRPVELSTIEGAGYDYQWYKNNVPLTDATEPVYSFTQGLSSPSSDTYKVVVNSEGCVEESSETLQVHPESYCEPGDGSGGGGGDPCTDEASFTVEGCQPFTFTNTSSETEGSSWEFGDGFRSSAAQPRPYTYNEVGQYRVTLRNGCDSHTERILVPVRAAFTVPDVVCQGMQVDFTDYSVNMVEAPIDSWTWEFGDGTEEEGSGNDNRNTSHTYTSAGEYTVYFTVRSSAGGCEHTASIDITVHEAPKVDFDISDPACNSTLFHFTNNSDQATTEAVYSWDLGNGVISGRKNAAAEYGSPGEKTVTLAVTDFLSCSADTSISFTVNEPVEVQDITVTGNLKMCEGDSILLTSPFSETGYTWHRNGQDMELDRQEIYVKEEGNYSVTYNESECTVITAPVEVEQFIFEDTEIEFENPVCTDGNLVVSVPGVSNYFHSVVWEKNDTVLSHSRNEFTLNNLSHKDEGIYTATVQDNETGCAFTLPEKELVVNTPPAVPVPGSNRSAVCYGDSAKVFYTNPIDNPSISWTVNNRSLSEESDTLKLYSLKSDRSVKLQVTDNSTGCTSSSEDYKITVGSPVNLSLSGDTDVCERSGTSFSANVSDEHYDFAWYHNGTLLGNTEDRLDLIALSMADSGSYHAVAVGNGSNSVNGCTYISDTVKLRVKEAPTVPEITGDREFCEGSTVTLESSAGNNIVWNNGATSQRIRIYEGGIYNVTVTNPETGCEARKSVEVQENPLPDLSFIGTGVYEYCASEPVVFSGLEQYATYQWKLDGVDAGKPDASLYPRRTGKYTVSAVTDEGCEAESDTLRITSLPCACIVMTTEDNLNVGSLRDAIYCANEKPGPDLIYFAIPGDGPFVLSIDSALPVIEETVAIDGFSQTADGVYDITIQAGDYGSRAFEVMNSVDGSEFSGLQFEGFDNSIKLNYSSDDNLVENNRFTGAAEQVVLVSGASNRNIIRNNYFESDGSGEAVRLSYGKSGTVTDNSFTGFDFAVRLNNSTGNTISLNHFDEIAEDGILLTNSSGDNSIISNTFADTDSNAIAVEGSAGNEIKSNIIGEDSEGNHAFTGLNGIFIEEGSRTFITGNTISGAGADGVKVSSSGEVTITGNVIGKDNRGNIRGVTGNAVTADSGVVIQSNSLYASGLHAISLTGNSYISQNLISNSAGSGILIVDDSVSISRNIITNTDRTIKAIDLNNTGNQGKEPAEFTDYHYGATEIELNGLSLAGDTVEIFLSEDAPQQALNYVGKTVADASGTWSLTIPAGPLYNPDTKNYYVNTATKQVHTSELSETYTTGCYNCVCEVVNADNAGTGSLRAAVDSAHAGTCGNIRFSMEPATIDLEDPLREITVPVNIHGIEGMVVNGPGTGTGIATRTRDIMVNKLKFTNWETAFELKGSDGSFSQIDIDETANPFRISGNDNRISASCINCASDVASSPVDTGIVISGNGNLVESSEIVNALETGIVADGGNANSFLYNQITGTQRGIEHLNSGNNSYPAPLDLSTSFEDNGQAIMSGTAQPGDVVQVFLSDFTGKPASEFVTEIVASSAEWSLVIPEAFAPEDENTFFVVTATGSDGNTSEFSRQIKLGDNATYCIVDNTQNEGPGSLRSAVDCANEAGKGDGAPAYIVFDLPSASENVIDVKGEGFEITNNYGVTIDPDDIPVRVKGQNKLPYAFNWESEGMEVYNMTFENFNSALRNNGGNNAEANSNTFIANDTAITVTDTVGVEIAENTITGGYAGIYISGAEAEIKRNKIGTEDGVSLSGYGILLEKASGSLIDDNTIRNIGGASPGAGADLTGRGIAVINGSGYNIVNNRIYAKNSEIPSSIHIAETEESALNNNRIYYGKNGIDIYDSENLDIKSNLADSVTAYGINLERSEQVEISENLAVNLPEGAKPVHLNYNATNESNYGQPVPEFNYATYKKRKLILRGTAGPNEKVEIFETDTVDSRDLIRYLGSATADRQGDFEFSISVLPNNINDISYRATARVSEEQFYFNNLDNHYTSEASLPFNPGLKICFVTKETDVNEEGTLRHNIHKANNDQCHLMLFDVPDVSSVHIAPETELPEITAKRLTIDATNQPGFSESPIAFVEDEQDFVHALKINSPGDISIHGLGIRNYDKPILLDSIDFFETSLSSYEEFKDEAITFDATSTTSVKLDSNAFVSSEAPVALKITSPNVTATANIIRAGYSHAVEVYANDVALTGNDISYEEPDEGAFAIYVHGADSLLGDNNTITKYENGIKAVSSHAVQLMNNRFENYNRETVLHKAAEMDSLTGSQILSSYVSYADTAFVLRNSPKIECSGNEVQLAQVNGVLVYRSDSAVVSSNRIRRSRVAIQLDSSWYSKLEFNTLLNHDSAGVIIDSLSEEVIFNYNSIGAATTSSPEFSLGTGLYIYSSNNLIGESDTAGNAFVNNFGGGVIVTGGTGNRITYNTFIDNDSSETRPSHFAIKHEKNGNNLKEKPEFDSYSTVDEGIYHVTGMAEPGDSVHIYRSEGHYQNANYYLGVTTADAGGKWSFTVDTSDQKMFERPLVYQTLTLVATATDAGNNTSELSDIFYVGNCYVKSNLDNTDDQYPYPNSFRQAVLCANSQDEKGVILFAIDGSTGFDIALKKEMIPLGNTYGLHFDGRNILNDNNSIKVFESYEDPSENRFWHITDSVGQSEYQYLRVQGFADGIHFSSSDSTEIRHFGLLNIDENAFVVNDDAENISFDSLTTEACEGANLLNLKGNNRNISLTNSDISAIYSAISAKEADSVQVRNNTFAEINAALEFSGSTAIEIDSNMFELDSAGTAVLFSDTRGFIRANTFNDNDTLLVNTAIRANESGNVKVLANKFPEINDYCIHLNASDSSVISGNEIGKVRNFGVYLENTTRTVVESNVIEYIETAAFELRNSDTIFLSKNLVKEIDTSQAGVKLININKTDLNRVSNHAKEEPDIQGYRVKKEAENCEDEKLGIYLYGEAEPYDSIEVFLSDTLTTTFEKYVTATRADAYGDWEVRIPKTFYNRDPEYIYSFTATATDTFYNTSQEAVVHRFDTVQNSLWVTSTADSGPETLRDAIEKINCSDIFSKVYFKIEEDAPFEIALQDSLPHLDAFRGFEISGKTQADFHEVKEISDKDSTIYITGSSYFDDIPLFIIASSTDSSAITDLVIRDAASAIKTHNSGNRFSNLKIRNELEGEAGDTAIILNGSGSNRITDSEIHGYDQGVNLAEGTSANELSSIAFSGGKAGVILEGNNSRNTVKNSSFAYDSVGVILKGLETYNFIQGNTFGTIDAPINGTAIKLHNASSQVVENNYMPAGLLPEPDTAIAFIEVGDSCNANQIMNNKIGIAKDGFTYFTSDMVGILLMPDTEGNTIDNNVVRGNQVAGLTKPAVVLRHANGGSVQGNFFGVDSAFAQRENQEGYSQISGIDTTALLIDSSAHVLVNANTIVNFASYAIDVRASENITMTANEMFSERSGLKAVNLNLQTDVASNNEVQAPEILEDELIGSSRILIKGTSEYGSSPVQIYEGFSFNDDPLDHSLRYITTVTSEADGDWEIELPSSNFGFNKYNKYIAQVSKGNNTSEFSPLYTVQPLLCELSANGIDLLDESFEPCPESKFKVDAVLEGLEYNWTAEEEEFAPVYTKVAAIDTSAMVNLTIKDGLGCEHVESFEVRYKPRPVQPELIVASDVYVSDTIVLIDIAEADPEDRGENRYEWSSDSAVSIVSQGNITDPVLGPDGKIYPSGREIRFIVPDEGTYIVKQRSLLNGCFVDVEKEVSATYKSPSDPDPYALTPGVNSLTVYPSPVLKGETTNAYIETTTEDAMMLEVVNLNGSVEYSTMLSGQKNYNVPLDMTGYTAGTYLVRITMNSGSLIYKIVVE